jgi:hypothetical protein
VIQGQGLNLDLHPVHHGRRILAHTSCEIPTASSQAIQGAVLAQPIRRMEQVQAAVCVASRKSDGGSVEQSACTQALKSGVWFITNVKI